MRPTLLTSTAMRPLVLAALALALAACDSGTDAGPAVLGPYYTGSFRNASGEYGGLTASFEPERAGVLSGTAFVVERSPGVFPLTFPFEVSGTRTGDAFEVALTSTSDDPAAPDFVAEGTIEDGGRTLDVELYRASRPGDVRRLTLGAVSGFD